MAGLPAAAAVAWPWLMHMDLRIAGPAPAASPIYTRWSLRALDRWQNLFAVTGYPLFQRTGILWFGRDADVDPYNGASLAAFVRMGVPQQNIFTARSCTRLSASRSRLRSYLGTP